MNTPIDFLRARAEELKTAIAEGEFHFHATVKRATGQADAILQHQHTLAETQKAIKTLADASCNWRAAAAAAAGQLQFNWRDVPVHPSATVAPK